MALTKRGEYDCGDSQADIRDWLTRFTEDAYLVQHFADARCECGGHVFELLLDENEGAAIRICDECGNEHPIGDSDDYLDDAELEKCECVCGECRFEITVGVSLYSDSEDVRWLYLGGRCPACGVVGCFGDWKNEYADYRRLLARV